MALKWDCWLQNPYRLGGPQSFTTVGKIRSGPHMGLMATSPLPSGDPKLFQVGNKMEVANQWARWQRHPCRLRVPNASKPQTKSEVARIWVW